MHPPGRGGTGPDGRGPDGRGPDGGAVAGADGARRTTGRGAPAHIHAAGANAHPPPPPVMPRLPRRLAGALLVAAPLFAAPPLAARVPASAPRAALPADGPSLAAAPLAAPVRFGDARLRTGVRLRYAVQGDPSGQPVILLHGYSDSWYSFSRLLPLLPVGLRVYALDQRGHGGSDRPATGYAMRDLVADVLAFMDAQGIARATIVGHSMGSFVAQQVALAAPGRVARLALVGSATSVRRFEGIDALRPVVDSLRDPIPEPFAREFQLSTIHHPVPAAFVDRVVADSRKLPARAWRQLMDGMFAAEPPVRLRASRIPTLVLWGERDAFVGRAEQHALVALLGTATLIAYPETGHAPHWERPDDVARDLAAFIPRS